MAQATPRDDERARPPAPETLTAKQTQRRQAIIDATLKLLSNNNGNVEIRDVASEAGVALGTVYHYFGSKESLFAHALLKWCGQYWDELRAYTVGGGTNAERLGEVTRHTVEAYQREPQFFSLGQAVYASDDPDVAACWGAMREGVTALYAETLQGIDPQQARAIASTILSVLSMSVMSWLAGHHSIDAAYETVDRAVHLIVEYRDPALDVRGSRTKSGRRPGYSRTGPLGSQVRVLIPDSHTTDPKKN